MSRRFRRRYTTTLPDITLTPLIDTVLVLLIIFMIAMPVLQTYIPIELPQAQHGQHTQTETPICVYIDAQSYHYVNSEHVAVSRLSQAIENALAAQQDKGVIVYADKQVSYGVVMSLLDHLRDLESASYVTLAAEYTDAT